MLEVSKRGRQVNQRAIGNGVKLRDENGGGWEIKKVLYAHNIVLVAETRELSSIL